MDYTLGKVETFVQGTKIAFVLVNRDTSPPIPVSIIHRGGRRECADWDGNGAIFAFNSQTDADEGSRLVREENALPLSCFRHSGEHWGLMGELDHWPDARWDLTRFAGVWVPDEAVMENVRAIMANASHKWHDGEEPNRTKVLTRYAEACIDEFNQYCQGDVYEYTVTIHTLKIKDGEPLTEEGWYAPLEGEVDSCGGFYGMDGVNEALQEFLEGFIHA